MISSSSLQVEITLSKTLNPKVHVHVTVREKLLGVEKKCLRECECDWLNDACSRTGFGCSEE